MARVGRERRQWRLNSPAAGSRRRGILGAGPCGTRAALQALFEAFDGRGNYTIGVREQLIFPEIDFNKVDKLRGMNISIVTTARNDDQARSLLKGLGMPFRS